MLVIINTLYQFKIYIESGLNSNLSEGANVTYNV
ncbi:MAG: hypothetical protein ACD_5C00336G0002, partial [uncultured bacterium]